MAVSSSKAGNTSGELGFRFSEALPRFIETDYVSIQAADSLNAIAKRSVDVIAYIGPHVLKIAAHNSCGEQPGIRRI